MHDVDDPSHKHTDRGHQHGFTYQGSKLKYYPYTKVTGCLCVCTKGSC